MEEEEDPGSFERVDTSDEDSEETRHSRAAVAAFARRLEDLVTALTAAARTSPLPPRRHFDTSTFHNRYIYHVY